MVNNRFIQCNACGMKINLRIQMGRFDIPFHIHCPDCHSTIHGKVHMEENNIDIESAHSIDCNDEEFYSVELSAEFPTRKPLYKKISKIEFSPYMRNIQFYGDGEKAIKLTQETTYFADFIKFGLGEIKQNFELFWNNQNKTLLTRLEKTISKYPHILLSKINNNFDSVMALHQLLLTTTGISYVINKNSLCEYSQIGNLVVGKPVYSTQIIDFINTDKIDFNSIEKKGIKLVELFAKVYEQLIPVVALKNGGCFENVDKEKYGIMTANFDELTDFYAKSYEWILDNISVVLGLNNIYVRNDSSQCINGKAYKDFIKESNGNRIKNGYIGEEEPFSKPISSLNNRIRNAIQHFDSDIDYGTQLITFKDRAKKVELYLMDFTDLCIENFGIVFYILELVYNLRKLTLMQEGIFPSISVKDSKIADMRHKNKIGRNEPCPCGSGKKYKRCCGI
ncbi:YecA family protein [Scatolibacter rhodanostii]|uniref:YecA family protein n=1 Tax=Scatolibacter rhodanostii TaxID=2014781 RepID=UPI000C06CAF1|nr:SEC-C metal-binding domain-containing protein [Scatolibacter rhodanostii]